MKRATALGWPVSLLLSSRESDMTHRDTLLRAIHHDPAEDTLRLAYADWLEENGDQQHAEFVRVQVALSKPFDASMCELVSAVWCPTCGDCTCPNREDRMDDDSCPLHSPYSRHAGSSWLEKRERKLLAIIEPVVRRGAKCERCFDGYVHTLDAIPISCNCHGGYTGTLAAQHQQDEPDGSLKGEWIVPCDWSRGFPFRVYCTLAEYQREVGRKECPECEGHRWEWWAGACRVCGAVPDPETGWYEHGSGCYQLSENGGGEEQADPCPACNAQGTIPITWAEALLREHGTITEVVLTDREPERDQPALAAGFSYDWLNGDEMRRNDAATLPGYLFEATRLQNSSHNPPGFNFAEWLTEADARTALARAAADHARQLAGLPRVWAGSRMPA